MIGVEVSYNLDKLGDALHKYMEVSKKTPGEVILKQSAKLAWNLFTGLRRLAPKSGAIMAERLAALKAGVGVKVRPVVYADVAAKYGALTSVSSGKTFLNIRGGKSGRGKVIGMATEVNVGGKMLNLQALAVKRELTLRNSARGFSAFAVPRPPRSYAAETARQDDVDNDFEIFSRYGFMLSHFGIKIDPEAAVASLAWKGRANETYEDALSGLSKPQQERLLVDAIAETNADIMKYVLPRLKEDLKTADLI